MNAINEETTIAQAIIIKGERTAKIIDGILCDGEKTSHSHCTEEKPCCPGTSLALGAAAKLMKKNDLLIGLLQKLNHLPNHCKCKKER